MEKDCCNGEGLLLWRRIAVMEKDCCNGEGLL